MRKLLSVLLMVALVLSTLLPVASVGIAEETEPLTVTIFGPTGDSIGNREKSRVELKVEEMVGATFEFDGAPWASYTEKVNLLMASGDYPMLVYQFPSEITRGWFDDGMLSSFDEYIEGTRNLSKLFAWSDYEYLTYDGEHTFVPNICERANMGWVYRQDWAEKLGLGEPATIEEFIEMLRAFTEDDPDGNGAKDTYGLASDPGSILNLYGISFNGLDLSANGEVIWSYASDDFKAAMKAANSVYAAGYAYPEYFAEDRDQRYEKFINGKYGVFYENTGIHMINRFQVPGEKINSEYKLGYFNPYPTVEGALYQGAIGGLAGMYGGIFFTDAIGDDMAQLIEVVDRLFDLDVVKTRMWGIEGQSYVENADGSITLNLEERIADKIYGSDGLQYSDLDILGFFGCLPMWWEGDQLIVSKKHHYNYTVDWYNEIAEESDLFANATPRFELDKNTFLGIDADIMEYKAAVSATANEWVTLFVTGEKSVDTDWEEYMSELEADGLSDVISAYTAELQRIGKIK